MTMSGMILIEVCDANAACVPELFDLESDYVEVSVLENSCMSHCELCAANPYVFFEGELVHADTTAELLTKIRDLIVAATVEF